MPAFLILFFRFLRSLWSGLKDPEFRSLFYWVAGFLALGTWFYARVEGWSILDSLYFSVITLTTVGYGDFSPQTPTGKIFTMIYILVGLGLISGFVYLLADRTGVFKKNNAENSKDVKD
ncbi:MAG: potassium channel family protein [Anaerolineales bacterium]